jgi:hypothetical protein
MIRQSVRHSEDDDLDIGGHGRRSSFGRSRVSRSKRVFLLACRREPLSLVSLYTALPGNRVDCKTDQARDRMQTYDLADSAVSEDDDLDIGGHGRRSSFGRSRVSRSKRKSPSSFAQTGADLLEAAISPIPFSKSAAPRRQARRVKESLPPRLSSGRGALRKRNR